MTKRVKQILREFFCLLIRGHDVGCYEAMHVTIVATGIKNEPVAKRYGPVVPLYKCNLCGRFEVIDNG